MSKATTVWKLQPLQKLAHAMNIDFLALNNGNFQLKCFDIFLIFALICTTGEKSVYYMGVYS